MDRFPLEVTRLVSVRMQFGLRAQVPTCWPGHSLGSLLWGIYIGQLRTWAQLSPVQRNDRDRVRHTHTENEIEVERKEGNSRMKAREK